MFPLDHVMREVWWICGSLMHVMFYNVANFHNRIQSASYLLARPYELCIGRRKFELREREAWSLTDFVAHRQNDRAFFFFEARPGFSVAFRMDRSRGCANPPLH